MGVEQEIRLRMFNVSEAWKTAYPGAALGILVMHNVANPERHSDLDRRKDELEHQLRTQFAGRNVLAALPTIQAYNAYFKRYKKTYHVLLQLESVVLKGKPIPRVASLVEAMVLAELKNQLLTAGYNLEAIQMPIRGDVVRGNEQYVLLNSQEQALKAGDMLIADAQGVISPVP